MYLKAQLYQITFYQQIDCPVPEKSKNTMNDKKEGKIKKKMMERIRKWKKRIRTKKNKIKRKKLRGRETYILKITVSWNVTLYSLIDVKQRSRFLRKLGKYVPDYTASHAKIQ
jgi:hypothetical protein